VDNVNIMAYDASGLMLNDSQVLVNFVELGNVPAMKINMVRLRREAETWRGVA
jgi:hypothetical protein